MRLKSAIRIAASFLINTAVLGGCLDEGAALGFDLFAGQITNSLSIVNVTASGHDGNEPLNTLDGDISTRWSASGDNQWIRYDLGAPKSLVRLDIAWYKGDQRRSAFDIEVSEDDKTFRKVYSGESSGTSTSFESYAFAPVTAQFVRLVGHGNKANGTDRRNPWNSVTEVAVIASGSTGSEPNPNPTPAPSPTPNSGSASIPSQLLPLTAWKLTLPVNTSHDGDPDQIKQPELNNFQHAQYFFVNSAKNGVVFRAYTTNVTTSNSNYPRSELREMQANGDDEASWSTTSGTHEMVIQQAITHLPTKLPEVIAGQIHGAGSAYHMLTELREDKRLVVKNKSGVLAVLDANYVVGKPFELKLVAGAGQIKVYYQGALKHTQNVSASGCYFKAGSYAQSNFSIEKTDREYAEVVIYKLSVTHR